MFDQLILGQDSKLALVVQGDCHHAAGHQLSFLSVMSVRLLKSYLSHRFFLGGGIVALQCCEIGRASCRERV